MYLTSAVVLLLLMLVVMNQLSIIHLTCAVLWLLSIRYGVNRITQMPRQ